MLMVVHGKTLRQTHTDARTHTQTHTPFSRYISYPKKYVHHRHGFILGVLLLHLLRTRLFYLSSLTFWKCMLVLSHSRTDERPAFLFFSVTYNSECSLFLFNERTHVFIIICPQSGTHRYTVFFIFVTAAWFKVKRCWKSSLTQHLFLVLKRAKSSASVERAVPCKASLSVAVGERKIGAAARKFACPRGRCEWPRICMHGSGACVRM